MPAKQRAADETISHWRLSVRYDHLPVHDPLARLAEAVLTLARDDAAAGAPVTVDAPWVQDALELTPARRAYLQRCGVNLVLAWSDPV